MTWIILWVTDRTVGLRVSPGDELGGLDLSEHGEVAYQLAEPEVTMTSDGRCGRSGSRLAARNRGVVSRPTLTASTRRRPAALPRIRCRYEPGQGSHGRAGGSRPWPWRSPEVLTGPRGTVDVAPVIIRRSDSLPRRG